MTSAEGDSIKSKGDSCLKAISRDNNGPRTMEGSVSMNGSAIMSLNYSLQL